MNLLLITIEANDLAWAAGFFDGEGNVTYYPSNSIAKRRPRIFVQLAQVDRRPLDRWQEIFEGRVNGPYKPKTESSRPYYVWSREGYLPTLQMFMQLGPFLCGPKFEDFANAIEYYATWMDYPLCHAGHGIPMNTGKNGYMFCKQCKRGAGLRSAKERWGFQCA